MGTKIRKVDRTELLGDLFSKFKAYTNAQQQYFTPGTAPVSDDILKKRISNKTNDITRYFAFSDNQIIGQMTTIQPNQNNQNYENDKGIINFNGFVLPEFRNKGLGSKLAFSVLKELDTKIIRSIRTYAVDEAGAKFCNRLGCKIVAQDSLRSVNVVDIDQKIIKNWKEIKFHPDKKPIITYHKSVDTETVNKIIDLSFATNIEIKELDKSESIHTIELEIIEWKEMLEYWKEIGTNLKCITLNDTEGKLIGYTLYMFMSDKPDIVGQSITAVWKHHRGNGYGKLLKALMIDHILKNHPQIKTIETENNDLNAPMVKINEKIGFEVKEQYYFYKLDYNKAIEHLRSVVL